MPIPPLNVTGQITGALPRNPPASSGDGTRQNRVPSDRAAFATRNIVRWMIPETGIVDMYINPQSIKIDDKKLITEQRTKGGFVVQYWGEDMTTISLNGTTGSSGVEGINVLFDIYRGEQVAFDPFAMALASALDNKNSDDGFLGDSPGGLFDVLGTGISNDLVDGFSNALESGSTSPTRPRPTLASLAFSVEMYWSGWSYRGYFTNFSVTEDVNNLGLFTYSMTFRATQRRGFRTNFLGWHRSPVDGPSNSDPTNGVPYSYNGQISAQQVELGRQTIENITSLDQALNTSRGFIGDPGSLLGSLI